MSSNWRTVYGGSCLKAQDVPKNAKVVTIQEVREKTFKRDDRSETKFVAEITGFTKLWVLNTIACEALEQFSGSADPDDWVGMKVEIYRDDNVRFGSKITSGIRCRLPSAKKRRKESEDEAVSDDSDLDDFGDEEDED